MPPRSCPALLLALAAFALSSAALAGPAHARIRGVCLPGLRSGPRCAVWTGRVTHVDDGDTLDVDVRGDRTRRPVRVRVTGIQAMEQQVYSSHASRRRGDCHALAATARLGSLVRQAHRRVRIAAQVPGSRSRGRARRFVALRIGGRWRDVGRRMLAGGHALWLPNQVEYAGNRVYGILAQRARAAGLNLWDTRYCGPGPSEGANLRMWVNSDADGDDAGNVDGEWVKIRNLDPGQDVAVGGWWLRDSDLRRYTFPAGATVPAGQTITLFVGRGATAGDEYFWGLGRPAFENATDDRRAMGDGAYLFDPEGDLRASMIYPCREGCSDLPAGALTVSVNPTRSEYVGVRNYLPRSVDLQGYRLNAGSRGYAFGADSVLAPDEVMLIALSGDPRTDTRLLRHWSVPRTILSDRGGIVRLATFTGIVVACDAWWPSLLRGPRPAALTC